MRVVADGPFANVGLAQLGPELGLLGLLFMACCLGLKKIKKRVQWADMGPMKNGPNWALGSLKK